MHWKKSLLVIYKILRPCVNTLTVDEKHYLLTRHNLTQRIQRQLSQKQKKFCRFFFRFLKSIWNLKNLPKKDDPLADVFLEIPAPENIVRLMTKKPCFRGSLDRTRQMGRNTVAIWMTAPLQDLLITVKVVSLEKVSFSDT